MADEGERTETWRFPQSRAPEKVYLILGLYDGALADIGCRWSFVSAADGRFSICR